MILKWFLLKSIFHVPVIINVVKSYVRSDINWIGTVLLCRSFAFKGEVHFKNNVC